MKTVFYKRGVPTHCRKGHELSGDTLYFRATGQYVCRKCDRDYYLKVAEHQRQKAKDRYAADPQKFRDRNKRNVILHKYGISLEDKQKMYAGQSGLCYICKRPLPSCQKSFIDHSHYTDEVRGLVHNVCNLKLGVIEVLAVTDVKTLIAMLKISGYNATS